MWKTHTEDVRKAIFDNKQKSFPDKTTITKLIAHNATHNQRNTTVLKNLYRMLIIEFVLVSVKPLTCRYAVHFYRYAPLKTLLSCRKRD